MGLTYKTFTYTQSAAKTPSYVVTTLSPFVYQIVSSNLNGQTVRAVFARFLDSSGGATSSTYPFSITSTGSNQISVQPQGSYLPCGTFRLEVHCTMVGYADSTSNILDSYFSTACQALQQATVTSKFSSYNGGGIITINQAGFITNDIHNNDIRICGIKAPIQSAS